MPLSVTAILYLYWDCSLLLVVLLVRHETHVGQKWNTKQWFQTLYCPILSDFADCLARFGMPRLPRWIWYHWHHHNQTTDLADKRPSLKSNNTSEYWIFITNTAYMSAGANYADLSDWKYWMVQRQDPGREGKYRGTNTGVTNMQGTVSKQPSHNITHAKKIQYYKNQFFVDRKLTSSTYIHSKQQSRHIWKSGKIEKRYLNKGVENLKIQQKSCVS